MKAEQQLIDVAWEILQTGKDRVPRIADRRAIQHMRHLGLIQYEDGYSVKPSVMERAARFWSAIAKDPYVDPAKAQEFQDFADKALEWAKRHQATPDIKALYFGKLPFDLYRILWKSATTGDSIFEGMVSKKDLAQLLRGGYIEPISRIGYDLTDKAKDLVREHGNPFLQAKTAERVAARFRSAAGYSNQMNGKFFSLWWGKSGWSIEESDAPMRGLVDMFSQSKNDSYTMPNIQPSVKSNFGILGASLEPEWVLHTVRIMGEDKGPEVRRKIVDGYKNYLSDMLKGLREPGGDPYQLADKFEAYLPKLIKRLVWKKV